MLPLLSHHKQLLLKAAGEISGFFLHISGDTHTRVVYTHTHIQGVLVG